MLLLIFTLDYEIFGNGEGNLKKLVYEPTLHLNRLFDSYNLKYVNFVEVGELIKIKENGSDNYIDLVEEQITKMYEYNHEIALHIHPQWFNGKYINNNWVLDYEEYNLSKLNVEKIDNYITLCIKYLRGVLNDQDYSPTSYRAGGWLIQPSNNIANILKMKKIIVDSSVFKGGYNRHFSLDFRKYPESKYFWYFDHDVVEEDSHGSLIEVPIYTKMVPVWEMYSKKRATIHEKMPKKDTKLRLNSYLDRIRFKYPQKFDFTKMTFDEMKNMIDELLVLDSENIDTLKPIVLIGHTKNLFDFESIEKLLLYAKGKDIIVTTFRDAISEWIKPNH